MIGSQTTSTIAEDSVASGTGGGGGGGAGGRIFVISDKNFRSSSFDQGRTGGTATTGNCSFKHYFIWRMNQRDFLVSDRDSKFYYGIFDIFKFITKGPKVPKRPCNILI